MFGRIRKTALAVLQQGLAPEQLALTVCLGTAVGTLPLMWGTTVICVALAARFGLNQAAMQAVNYLVYPLQIALFFPFFKLGAKYLPWGPSISAEMLQVALHGHLTSAISLLGWATLKAVGAWLVTVPPLALLLYPLLVSLFRRRRSVPDLDHAA
ncbi:DUF2062 domain-containing protein [Geomonas sp.]|uniref:DUF2062 domain-containing protein n=1 Tax=Geomonas sp. TaxID=2651584 RepID=UPI002B4924A7|nr:DUF2062 domain-containing protein [Geomonas sp.]HJV34034.1 DUF2062 domain-containing protein [Geomonas sp.]